MNELRAAIIPPGSVRAMTVFARAKINRTLEVYGKRPDGYHAIRSVVQPITLADELTFEPVADGVVVTDTGYGEKDLIVRAARVLAAVADKPCAGYRVRVTKNIPTGGGLGGGSADAAAALRALNDLWELGLTPERLAELGAAVGSDVPALVLAQRYGAPVLMEGRGETVRELTSGEGFFPRTPSRHLVLANAGVFSSTPAVYARCLPRQTPWRASSGAMAVNDLERPARELYPEIARTLEDLRAAGAADVLMSGSGATCFGYAASAAEAERLATHLRERGYRAWSAAFATCARRSAKTEFFSGEEEALAHAP